MTIIAKFHGTCAKCGETIKKGEEINWEKGKGATHVNCPEIVPLPDNVISISTGSGYGGRPYSVGQVLRSKEKILIVLKSGQKYYREDGLSFGVGDDDGYVYWAKCREATSEEAEPLIVKEEEARKVKEAKSAMVKIIEQIKKGERPEGQNSPEGERLYGKPDIYGGGEWIIIGPDWIWYVRNNGMDGDDWSRNNVTTAGAGAIGWRIPLDENLADEIKNLCNILGIEE